MRLSATRGAVTRRVASRGRGGLAGPLLGAGAARQGQAAPRRRLVVRDARHVRVGANGEHLGVAVHDGGVCLEAVWCLDLLRGNECRRKFCEKGSRSQIAPER